MQSPGGLAEIGAQKLIKQLALRNWERLNRSSKELCQKGMGHYYL